MKALSYLLITTIKNRIKNLKKKPGLLILYIVIIAYFIFIFAAFSNQNLDIEEQRSFADIRMLYMILAGLTALFTYISVMTGLSKGTTLFNMADVGILFVAPISSIKILIYGLIKQMGTTLLTSIFILFQIGNVKLNFDIDNLGLVSLFVIYVVILFYTHILTMVIYILTNDNPRLKQLVKLALAFVTIIILAIVAYYYTTSDGKILSSIYQTMDSKAFLFLPVIGWSVMFFASIIEGSLIWLIVASLLFIISVIGMIVIFTRDNGDYYEDVLVSTEANHITLQNAKEGKAGPNKKVKVRSNDYGFLGGKGPSTLFYKDLIEKKRGSRIPFVDGFTLIYTIIAGIFVFIIKEDFSPYMVLGFLIYMQFFMATMGSLSQELRKPYIYTIPGRSLYKLIFASLSSIIKPAIDALIIFTVVCLVSGTSPLLNLFMALAYTASSGLFISYTILMQRIFGAQPNKIVQGIVGIFLFIFFLMPGVILSAITVSILPGHLEFLGTLPFTLLCLVITAIVFIACGNLIDKSEIPA